MEAPYLLAGHQLLGSGPHSVSALCAATKFDISICPDSLAGTLFHTTYSNQRAKAEEKGDDGLAWHLLEYLDTLAHLVCDKCLPIFEQYRTTSQSFSLQDYIRPATYHVSIIKDDTGRSQDGTVARTSGEVHRSYSRGIGPVQLDQLDARAASITKFKASELIVSRDVACRGSIVDKVQTATGQTLFVKPRIDIMAPEFKRELSVLLDILEHGLHKTLNVSHLVGLVVLDDGLVSGLVMKWITARPIADYKTSIPHDRILHQAWKKHVVAIIDELHKHDIIWGDVNAHNILIDSSLAAWVIDFGGHNNIAFVDDELKETLDGDAQGIRRLFDEWLPE